MKQYYKAILITWLIMLQYPAHLFAWSEHPLLVRPVLEKAIDWQSMNSVEVKSIEQFLAETDSALAVFFLGHNERYQNILPEDALLPASLLYTKGMSNEKLRENFLRAIRVNPNIKIPLYLHLVPGQEMQGFESIHPSEVTTLNDIESMMHTNYIKLVAGSFVTPFDVLVTANDEPDYGFDLGLFDDNGTDYGMLYSFGKQPYGNPNLEYSSQAPFHMGFYHEARILYRFGPFLKRTFLEYRINLYRDLSILAFNNGQDYWGWRFLGWSMHYAGDATMPYHTKPLPGYSTLRMIWINLKAMLGFKQARTDAIQLVSNKHTVIESYQHQVLLKAYLTNNTSHALLVALREGEPLVPYDDQFIRQVATKRAAERSKKFDQTIKKYMPAALVLDPANEAAKMDILDNVSGVVSTENGAEGTEALNNAIAERFRDYHMVIRSLFYDVVKKSGSV